MNRPKTPRTPTEPKRLLDPALLCGDDEDWVNRLPEEDQIRSSGEYRQRFLRRVTSGEWDTASTRAEWSLEVVWDPMNGGCLTELRNLQTDACYYGYAEPKGNENYDRPPRNPRGLGSCG